MSYNSIKVINGIEFKIWDKSVQIVTDVGAEMLFFNKLITEQDINTLNRIIQMGIEMKRREVKKILKNLID
jgi:hypothetical protein